VAVLINKAMIEIPPKVAGRPPVGPIPKGEKQTKAKGVQDWSGAKGLAEDVRRYGAWVRDEAEKRIGHLYPKVLITKEMGQGRPDLRPLVGQNLTVIAWLWARTVKSPNPAFAHEDVPLVSSFVVASRSGKEVFVQPVVEKDGYRFVLRTGRAPKGAENGTKASGRGANFECLLSRAPITAEYIRSEGRAGRIGVRLLAVVAESSRGRAYLSPAPDHELIAATAKPPWKPDVEFLQQALGFRVGNYGLTKWSHLFTARQLTTLTTLCELVQATAGRCRADAVRAGMPDDGVGLAGGGTEATAYGEAVATYLALAVDKSADYNSALVLWSPTRDQAKTTFARQALSMVWDFAEVNPVAGAAGDFRVSLEGVCRSVGTASTSQGVASQADAQSQDVSTGKVVSTDPPYYDNIGYADLSDFFYVWLRRSLKPIYPGLLATLAVPKAEELVATPYRHGGKKEAEQFFLTGMTSAFLNVARRARPDCPITIYYAFKQSDTADGEGTASTGWETFLEALLGARFCLTGTWPMHTEREVRTRGLGSNALGSSIVHVCRPRDPHAPTVARREFLRQLERTLPLAILEMTADPEASVAPADLSQAVIGPGMAIFSRFASVLEADGSAMSVHNALIHINKVADDHFAHTEGELDPDSRFCVGWFQEHGFDAGPFGKADVVARAKGTAVSGVQQAGVLSATKGKVRLLRIKEYPKKWDPTTDNRVPIWEACHQMCRALGESEKEAGALLARMPEKQDAIRHLAYRLYTICERQKWAEDARPYNELITSWPAIVEHSVQAGHRGEQLDLL
jgi:putative DNA methylase